jgi:hypothetical protein
VTVRTRTLALVQVTGVSRAGRGQRPPAHCVAHRAREGGDAITRPGGGRKEASSGAGAGAGALSPHEAHEAGGAGGSCHRSRSRSGQPSEPSESESTPSQTAIRVGLYSDSHPSRTTIRAGQSFESDSHSSRTRMEIRFRPLSDPDSHPSPSVFGCISGPSTAW